VTVAAVVWLTAGVSRAAVYDIQPATVDTDEEFENIANKLRPADELVVHRRRILAEWASGVTVRGTRISHPSSGLADRQSPLLTRPADNIDRHNNIEFVDCSYLLSAGCIQGRQSGVRFIRGDHVTLEDLRDL